MKIYRFRFNNSKKTLPILFWFFATLITISLTIILFTVSDPLFPSWLLLISIPLMFIAIYKLFKTTSARKSTEVISLNEEGFKSSCFGSILFYEIHNIRVPIMEIGLLGGAQLDYYKKTDVDFPYLEFSITTKDGRILKWILNEWGGLYNSKEEFSIFYSFLEALTDQLHQRYHADEPYKSYLKILDEKGFWEKQH
ncbi:hypothetical protein [Pedobacter punctiformis]|uniref:Uncharacterized protein n=1 Tax=Pedobacter punctiformis TaxID=3004097 RepID=A0ABT4LBM7_9SPHI|nr:hypothetical protein [Pedobacter sp. HCMS5-2]MCZ4244214.1 hypothetical protein [Pedobacter sp. HCMS5-2]